MHKVYSIKKKKYSKKYFVNFVDFTFDSIELSLDVIMKYGIAKDKEIDENTLIEAIGEQRLKDAKNSAYNFVSYKPRSEYEVRKKLESKDFSLDIIDSAINFLYEFGLLDDKKFAEMFINSYLKAKPSGLYKLTYELKKRGIDQMIIEQSIMSFYPNDKSVELAQEAARKHLKKISHKPAENQKKLIYDFLSRRGFNWEDINKVLEKMKL